MFFKKWIKTEMSPQKWFHLLMSIFPLHLAYIVLLRCENFHSCRKKKLHKSGKVSNGIRVNIFRSLQKDLTILLSPKTQNKVCSHLTLFPQHDKQGWKSFFHQGCAKDFTIDRFFFDCQEEIGTLDLKCE